MALAMPLDTPLPEAWEPDQRPVIPGDTVREVAGRRVHHWDGQDFLSVSTVLGTTAWGNLSHVPPAALEWGRERGTLVDRMCRWLEMGVLDWDSVDKRLLPYVKAWQLFMAETEYAAPEIEALVVNPATGTFGYADRRLRATVIDIKTSAVIGQSYRYQLTAYCANGERPLVVQLKKNGKYQLHDFSDTVARDRARFAILAEEAHLWIAEQEQRK